MSSTYRVKLDCCKCQSRSFPNIHTDIPCGLGQLIVCMKCLKKFIYWNKRFFELGKEVTSNGTSAGTTVTGKSGTTAYSIDA